MKRALTIILALLLTAGLLTGCVTESGNTPSPTVGRPEESPLPTTDEEICYLRVNYETEPECVEGDPVFSWAYNTDKRSLVQKNYRIRLADSKESFDKGEFVWDSGIVESNINYGVKYTGESLKEAKKYYWDVKVTTNSGVTYQSAPSYFYTALTETGFRGADWIRDEAPTVGIEDANWIWLLSGDTQGSVKIKTEYFKYIFKIDKPVKSAAAAFSADDYGEYYVNGNLAITITKESGWQNGLVSDITEYLKQGTNVIAAKIVNSEVGYGALISAIKLNFEDGTSKTIVSDGSWYGTETKQKSGFEKTESLDGFKKVNSVTRFGNSPWFENCHVSKGDGAAPIVRGTFNAKDNIKSAILYASAAGLYDVYVNGTKADDSALNPGRSEYPVRTMYQSYDVTEMVQSGKNVIGAMLGRGWYIGAYSPYGGTNPAFIAKLVIDYADGSREYFCTGKDWLVSTEGPVLYDDIFNGEKYDARRVIKDFADPLCTNSSFGPVSVTDAKELGIGELVPQLSGKVKIMKEISAKSVTKIAKDTYIYDFGQNLAGVPMINFIESEGTEITLRHAEMLNDGNNGSDGPKGTLYTANLRSAQATDTYIASSEKGTYAPTFTFHGFRYLEIKGIKSQYKLEDVKALVLYSDLEDTGRLETSDELINKLFLNTLWGQRGNFLSTPTDCPQRDERMGWSGDAQIFCGTAAYNMNVKTFFDKYITDLNDCQHSDGSYPDVAPETGRANYGGSGNNAWGDAGVIIPWIMYERYGDKSYIEKYYDNMVKYSKYLLKTSNGYIREKSAYGDWLSIDESTPVGVTDTAYCVRVFDLLSEMARILGKEEDIEKFSTYADKYRNAWINNYVKKEGKLKTDTQTAYLVALAFDILPVEQRAAMAERLNEKIVKKGTLTTGFIGCNLLLPVLCEYGYTDTAFMLLQQEEYPSWKYPILQGATTIWERWNSYTIENGFGDAGMNSFNHYSYGSVTEWLYNTLLGINPAVTGSAFSYIDLKPTAGGGITYAKGSYNSIHGLIESEWTASDDKITAYKCTVPGNTHATLVLKAESIGDIKEGGIALSEVPDIQVLSFDNGIATLYLGSGTYSFEIGG